MKFSIVNKDKLIYNEQLRIARKITSLFKETYAEALMHQLDISQTVVDKVLLRKGRE